jgi:hypothetical protein
VAQASIHPPSPTHPLAAPAAITRDADVPVDLTGFVDDGPVCRRAALDAPPGLHLRRRKIMADATMITRQSTITTATMPCNNHAPSPGH